MEGTFCGKEFVDHGFESSDPIIFRASYLASPSDMCTRDYRIGDRAVTHSLVNDLR